MAIDAASVSAVLDAASLKQRAAQRLVLDEAPSARDLLIDAPRGDHVINPGMTMSAEARTRNRLAAVLIPIIAYDEGPRVLLTQRTEHLPSHAGQVAFPGGKVEAQDESPLAAALREAHEEVGLPPDRVEALGYLHPYQTMSGYRIIPVVGLVAPGITLTPDANEVADVFEVPLSFLMDPANHQRQSRVWNGQERFYFVMPYETRYIWGVTAGIIRELYHELFE